MLEYKGYTGIFEYDEKADTFVGEVIDLNDVITFEGRSIEELKQALQDSIDVYLEFCIEKGKKPEKPFSGKFVVRVEPEIHRQATIQAKTRKMSLNKFVENALLEAVSPQM